MSFLSRKKSHLFLGLIFMGIGFLNRKFPLLFENLIPEKFSDYKEYISWIISIITILSGIGLLFKQTRRLVKWPLLTIIIMAGLGSLGQILNIDMSGATNLLPPFWVKLKLPVQIGLGIWLWGATKEDSKPNQKMRKRKS